VGRAGDRAAGAQPIASSGRRTLAAAVSHGPVATIAGLLLAAAFAAWASGTKPFTTPADIAVSIPSAVFMAALVLERRWPDRGPWQRLPVARPESDGGGVLWLAVIVVLVGAELASYFHSGPRADYPTVSSGLTALFAHRDAKAAGFFLWLAIGWFLARR